MIYFISLFGISLPVILLYFNLRKYPSVIYLSGFFLMISLYGITQYVFVKAESVPLVRFFTIHFGFAGYLVGPMLYLYVRSVITDTVRLQKSDLLHLLPVLTWLLVAAPYLLAPKEFKTSVVSAYVLNPGDNAIFYDTRLNWLLPVKITYLLRPLLVLFYLGWSIKLVVRFTREGGHSMVFRDQRFMTRWLYLFFGFILIMFVTHFIIILEVSITEDLGMYTSLNVLQYISWIGLSVLMISPFFFPYILYGMPQVPETEKSDHVHSLNGTLRSGLPDKQEEAEEAGVKANHDVHRNSYHLEQNYLKKIGEKADACMKESMPYLDPDFTMARLSVLTGIPMHHLHYFFKESKGESFIDYRNKWRVEHAKKLIHNGEANDMTMEAIGNMSGFSSRNTFLSAFKKREGTSPGNYTSRLKS